MNKSESDRVGFGFESPNQGDKDEWLTPPNIIAAVGGRQSFDLDPCSPRVRPWDTARRHLTADDDGLTTEWGGADVRVWLNPPYGPYTKLWMRRMLSHSNGVALIFARTETEAFDHIWKGASGYLFLARRLAFYHVDGSKGKSATAPSVLVAFDNEASGGRNAESLRLSGLKGAYFGRALVIGGTGTAPMLAESPSLFKEV